MAKCEFKKGIFIQRTCGQAAYFNCHDCGISVCSAHNQAIEGSANEVLCHACHISKHNIQESDARVRYLDSDAGFSLWYSSFRIEHVGSRHGFMFDESDYHEFDMTKAGEHVYLDDDNGFFDS